MVHLSALVSNLFTLENLHAAMQTETDEWLMPALA
jgi:hypothetical protein